MWVLPFSDLPLSLIDFFLLIFFFDWVDWVLSKFEWTLPVFNWTLSSLEPFMKVKRNQNLCKR